MKELRTNLAIEKENYIYMQSLRSALRLKGLSIGPSFLFNTFIEILKEKIPDPMKFPADDLKNEEDLKRKIKKILKSEKQRRPKRKIKKILKNEQENHHNQSISL